MRTEYITLDCRDGVHDGCDGCGCDCHEDLDLYKEHLEQALVDGDDL